MKKIDLHQVDAFTDKLFGGNPAGIVTNADELTDQEMKNIAREMNLSETAFVLRPTTADADIKLRFFTPPGDEIKFCGHASIGALFQLAQCNLCGLGAEGTNEVRVETNAGVLPMMVTNDGTGPKITFTAPTVEMVPYRLQGEAFASEFGIPASLIKSDSTILRDANLNYVYIPASSLQELSSQVFDFTRIRQQFGQEKIVIFCFFVAEVDESNAVLQSRGLAPNVGVDEDPFTGSMQAGLVVAAKQNGIIPTDQEKIISKQGSSVGRPGFAEINHRTDRLTVTASAVGVFSAQTEV